MMSHTSLRRQTPNKQTNKQTTFPIWVSIKYILGLIIYFYLLTFCLQYFVFQNAKIYFKGSKVFFLPEINKLRIAQKI